MSRGFRTIEDFRREMQPLKPAKPPLGYMLQEMMRLKNNGYPKWFHHSDRKPEHAMNESEEDFLREQGYDEKYIRQNYPAHLFRRNLTMVTDRATGALVGRFELATADGAPGGFIEAQVVQNEAEEKKLLKEPATKIVGKWCKNIVDIEPLEEGPDEDPEISKARLEGELKEARRRLHESEAKK